jgi:hypothetical protein
MIGIGPFRLPHGESVTVYRSDKDNTLITLAMDAR